MKKLFFFLSLALAVALTGCKNDNKAAPVDPEDKEPIENTGDANIVYTYFLGTEALCGQTVDDAIEALSALKFQQMPESETEFCLNDEYYSVYATLIDDDDDKMVDILAVSIVPSDKKDHKVIFTQKVVLDFVERVGAEVKLLKNDVKCSFYGLYNMNGDQVVSADQYKDFADGKAVDAERLSGSIAFWLDNNIIKEFTFDAKEPQPFTGMAMSPVQIGDNDEFAVNFAFVNNSTIDFE